ncbi:MAG: TylF/MycF/NovP-related O-methyltransferase [Pseudomonadota bacterium]
MNEARREVPPVRIEGREGEPWVRLPTGPELTGWGREQEIADNQISRQTEKYLFFRRVFDFLSDNRIAGDYHEYGCHRCRTFRMALTEARRHDLRAMKFFAFDSFEGLPQPTSNPGVELWQRGALATSVDEFMDMVRTHGIWPERVRPVKGFYAHSLTPSLQRRFLDQESKIALAAIDCDLYESAGPVFKFIEPLLQEGSVIYIDDLFAGYKGSPAKGVARAFREFRRQSRFRFAPHLSVGWWGQSFIAYIEDDPDA